MTEMKFKRTGKFIREKRIIANISQVQIGEKLGYSSQFVANWERGVSAPPRHKIKELCKILAVTKKNLISQIMQDHTDLYFSEGN